MSAAIEKSRGRYGLIDTIRGAALLNMIAYHLCYDIFIVYGVWEGFLNSPWAIVWERLICGAFILVSGMSLHFSRHPYRRGLLVNLCGLLITAATLLFMPDQTIWFGVLNLLGCAMMIIYALRGFINRIPPAAGMAVSFLLFAGLFGLPHGYLGFFSVKLIQLPTWLYGCRFLAPLGLPARGFMSADYFPLIPWIFLFLCGYCLWELIIGTGRQELFRPRVPALNVIGRYSLWIYLFHQPVLYGICILIFGTQNS